MARRKGGFDMIPRRVKNANAEFIKPKDWALATACTTLSVRYSDIDGLLVQSDWEPTTEELETLNAGGSDCRVATAHYVERGGTMTDKEHANAIALALDNLIAALVSCSQAGLRYGGLGFDSNDMREARDKLHVFRRTEPSITVKK
jgi:hypothetical protein